MDDPADIRVAAVDAAAEGFDAELTGIVCDSSIICATGLGRAVKEPCFIDLAECDDDRVAIAGVGDLEVMRIPIEGRATTRFVVARTARPFTPEDLMLGRAMVRLMRLAVRTADAFGEQRRAKAEADHKAAQNRELADQLQLRHSDLMARFVRIQRLVSVRAPGIDALESIGKEAGRLFRGDQVGIRLVDDDGPGMQLMVAAPSEAGPVAQTVHSDTVATAIRLDRLATSPAEVGEPVGDDVTTDRPRPSTTMAAPLHRNGNVAGAVFVTSDRGDRAFDLEEQELLLILAGYMSVVLNEAATLETVRDALARSEWQATHDPLTDLANRRLVQSTLEAHLADRDLDGGELQLLFVDLDRFKSVNDLYGHAVGDRVILETAERLQRTVRPADVVGRLSGDEFVVIARDLPSDRADAMANRLADELSADPS